MHPFSEFEKPNKTYRQRIMGFLTRIINVQIATLIILVITTFIYIAQSIFIKGQLDVQRDQERRSLRAYVGKETQDLTFTEDHQIEVVLHFKNFGQTPAYKVANDLETEVVEFQENDKYKLGKIGQNAGLLRDTLYPQISIVSGKTLIFHLNSAEYKSFKKPVLLIYGILDYKDAFGVKHAHHYCSLVRLFNISDIHNIQKYMITQCANFNDDEDE